MNASAWRNVAIVLALTFLVSLGTGGVWYHRWRDERRARTLDRAQCNALAEAMFAQNQRLHALVMDSVIAHVEAEGNSPGVGWIHYIGPADPATAVPSAAAVAPSPSLAPPEAWTVLLEPGPSPGILFYHNLFRVEVGPALMFLDSQRMRPAWWIRQKVTPVQTPSGDAFLWIVDGKIEGPYVIPPVQP